MCVCVFHFVKQGSILLLAGKRKSSYSTSNNVGLRVSFMGRSSPHLCLLTRTKMTTYSIYARNSLLGRCGLRCISKFLFQMLKNSFIYNQIIWMCSLPLSFPLFMHSGICGPLCLAIPNYELEEGICCYMLGQESSLSYTAKQMPEGISRRAHAPRHAQKP